MNGNLTDKRYWEDKWDIIRESWAGGADSFVPEWHQLLKDAIGKYEGGTCIEVGCFPGRYLNYFRRVFNMQPEGIDLLPYTQSDPLARPYTVHTTDFLDFETDKRYDLVCSFGFIEHFKDVKLIIEKHICLAKADGIVIITVPNFVHGWRFISRRLKDSSLFESHNKNAMDVDFLSSVLKSVDCKSWSISVMRFSDRGFHQAAGAKKYLLRLIGGMTKWFPVIDRGLSTEILITIHR